MAQNKHVAVPSGGKPRPRLTSAIRRVALGSAARPTVEAVLGRAVIVLLLLAGPLLLLELGSRWLVAARSAVRSGFVLDFKPEPYTMFGASRANRDLNRLGYRGPVPEVPKPPGELRIAMLGASTVFLGNPPLPQLLQDEFHARGAGHVRVYNFGVVGSSSGIDLARLVFDVADREPDLVLMYNGGNDITTPFAFDPRPGYPMNFIAYENNPLLKGSLATYPVGALLAYGSNLMRLLFPNYFAEKFFPLQKLRREAGWKSEAWKSDIAEIYVRNLAKGAKVSQGFGAKFMAFVQPLVYFKDQLSPEEQKFIASYDKVLAAQQAGDMAAHAREMRERVLREIEASRTRDGATIVDLTGLYADTPGWVFTDVAHTKQDSLQPLAAEMYRQIVAHGALKE
jgi:lysophospholipase L1-like esterase